MLIEVSLESVYIEEKKQIVGKSTDILWGHRFNHRIEGKRQQEEK